MTAWTAVYCDDGNGGIVAYIEELPGTVAVAPSIEEATVRLTEELRITLEANRWLTHDGFKEARVVRREVMTVGSVTG